jgi:hypothetical protein
MRTWFSNHDIPLFYHPLNSLDLSPIEPVWHELKKIIHSLPYPPSTVHDLKVVVVAAWDELDVKDIDKHIFGMPD